MFSPAGNGWILNEQNGNLSYGIKWFDGDMVAVSLEEILEPDHQEVSESVSSPAELEEDEELYLGEEESEADNESEEEEG